MASAPWKTLLKLQRLERTGVVPAPGISPARQREQVGSQVIELIVEIVGIDHIVIGVGQNIGTYIPEKVRGQRDHLLDLRVVLGGIGHLLGNRLNRPPVPGSALQLLSRMLLEELRRKKPVDPHLARLAQQEVVSPELNT